MDVIIVKQHIVSTDRRIDILGAATLTGVHAALQAPRTMAWAHVRISWYTKSAHYGLVLWE